MACRRSFFCNLSPVIPAFAGMTGERFCFLSGPMPFELRCGPLTGRALLMDLTLHPVQPVTGRIRRVTLAMLDLDHRTDDRAARVDDLNVMHVRSIA